MSHTSSLRKLMAPTAVLSLLIMAMYSPSIVLVYLMNHRAETIYCPDTCYLIPIDEVSDTEASLRVELPKNKQKSGIRLASDYVLLLGCSRLVRRLPVKQCNVGSSPTIPAKI